METTVQCHRKSQGQPRFWDGKIYSVLQGATQLHGVTDHRAWLPIGTIAGTVCCLTPGSEDPWLSCTQHLPLSCHFPLPPTQQQAGRTRDGWGGQFSAVTSLCGAGNISTVSSKREEDLQTGQEPEACAGNGHGPHGSQVEAALVVLAAPGFWPSAVSAVCG